MSDLASYSLQTIGLAALALVYFSRSKKINTYSLGLVMFWTIGVIFIYSRYGANQVQFYSNDQAFHQQIVEIYLPKEGINLRSFITLRYIITLPVFFLSSFGINIALAFKFMQLISALLIVHHSRFVLLSFGITIKNWMYVYIAGPLLVFMSLFALRDIHLALFALLFIFPKNTWNRYLALLVIAMLRPHLAAALLFGFVAGSLISVLKPKLLVLGHALLLLISYVFGALSFSIGDYVMNDGELDIASTIFSIKNSTQVALNTIGLQFLILDAEKAGVVAASTLLLLSARLIFIDSFLNPLTFFYFCTKPMRIVKRETLQISSALFFFYGLILQNVIITNSTRQNLPFITVMGLIAVIRLYESQDEEVQLCLPTTVRISTR
jgi:hypothetical protein